MNGCLVGNGMCFKRHAFTIAMYRIQILGALGDGSLLNVVLESTETVGTWRPVTAWWATRSEAGVFAKQKRNRHVR